MGLLGADFAFFLNQKRQKERANLADSQMGDPFGFFVEFNNGLWDI